MFLDDSEIDESLPPCIRFKQCMESSSLVHLMHCTVCCVKCLMDCDLAFVGEVLVPSIKNLIRHPNDAVSESMLMNLPDFCEQLEKSFPEEFEKILVDEILPAIYDLITSCAEMVGDAGSETLAALLTMVSPSRFVETQIPLLKELLASKTKDVRVIQAQVLTFLVDYFDPDVWYQDLFEMICTLSSDSMGSVRAYVPPLIAMYTKRIMNPVDKAQLSGRFALFAHDTATYVRKAAAEALVALSNALDDDTRELIVLGIVDTLLEDRVRTVSSVTQRNLGPLISTLGKKASPEIVKKYAETLTATDSNLAYAAAFSFPAVALALGKERFAEVNDGFRMATTSREYRIRKTLAFGLVSFGFIMDPEDLQSVAAVFLKDLPSIAVGIIGNLFQLIRMIPDKNTLKFCLEDPVTKYRDWRVRMRVSEQLRYCFEDYDTPFLFNIAKALVLDDVATVRRDAAMSFALLMTESDVSVLDEMATSESSIARLSAAHICKNVPPEKAAMCIPIVEKLHKDPVPNIRIRVAEAVIEIADYVRGNATLNHIMDELEEDPDPDVKQVFDS